jgi:hypothetical protein
VKARQSMALRQGSASHLVKAVQRQARQCKAPSLASARHLFKAVQGT